MKKKLFVVSDIHGHFTEFRMALNESGFEIGNPNHLLVFCGDLFDRGYENMKVMQFFERTDNCVMIRGNHEDMLLKIFQEGKLREHNFINGTLSTITEFFGKYAVNGVDNSVDFSGKNRMVDRITDLIMQMKDYYETENYVFVHGWLPNRNGTIIENWKKASEIQWETARFTKWIDAYKGIAPINNKIIVCGHVPTFYSNRIDGTRNSKDCSPYIENGIIAIDAGTHDTGKVNVVVLEDELI